MLRRLPLPARPFHGNFRGPGKRRRSGERHSGAVAGVASGLKKRRRLVGDGFRLEILPDLTAGRARAEMLAQRCRFYFRQVRLEQAAQVAQRRARRLGWCRLHYGYPY